MFAQQILIYEESLFRVNIFQFSSHMYYLKGLILNGADFSFQFVASVGVKEVSKDYTR